MTGNSRWEVNGTLQDCCIVSVNETFSYFPYYHAAFLYKVNIGDHIILRPPMPSLLMIVTLIKPNIEFGYGGSIKGSSKFSRLPSLPQKNDTCFKSDKK